MRFTDVFIKRPVFAASLSLLLLIMGLISFKNLTIRQYPKIEANVISISTSYPGASAETVESFVTSKIENAISGVPAVLVRINLFATALIKERGLTLLNMLPKRPRRYSYVVVRQHKTNHFVMAHTIVPKFHSRWWRGYLALFGFPDLTSLPVDKISI